MRRGHGSPERDKKGPKDVKAQDKRKPPNQHRGDTTSSITEHQRPQLVPAPPRALETHSPDSIPALDTQQPVTQWTCGPCYLTALQVRRLGAGFLSPDMTDIRGQAVNYSVWGHHAS